MKKVLWISLSAVFALVLSKQEDSGALISLFSPIVVVMSLVMGGFSASCLDKKNAYFASFIIGAACLGISYALSGIFNIGFAMGMGMKTVAILIMLLSPVLGAKIAMGGAKRRAGRRKM